MGTIVIAGCRWRRGLKERVKGKVAATWAREQSCGRGTLWHAGTESTGANPQGCIMAGRLGETRVGVLKHVGQVGKTRVKSAVSSPHGSVRSSGDGKDSVELGALLHLQSSSGKNGGVLTRGTLVRRSRGGKA